MSSVLATCEFPASKTNIMPDQSALRSVDLQLGHTFPVVITLHFLHAFSFATTSCPPLFSPSPQLIVAVLRHPWPSLSLRRPILRHQETVVCKLCLRSEERRVGKEC